MNGDMICAIHMGHVCAREREEALFFASSRYMLYLASTIVVLTIDCSSRDTIHLYVYVRPPQCQNWPPQSFR